MRNRGRTVSGFDVANGLLSRTDAFEKVAHMVFAEVKLLGAFRERSVDEVRVARLETSAVNPKPAFAAFKLHAVPLPFGVFHTAKDIVGLRGPHGLLDTVRVGEFHLILAKSGITSRDNVGEGFTFHRHRAWQATPPKRNIQMMGSPVGHGSPRIVVPIPKEGVAALPHVIHLWG